MKRIMTFTVTGRLVFGILFLAIVTTAAFVVTQGGGSAKGKLASSSTNVSAAELAQAKKSCTSAMTKWKCQQEIAGIVAGANASGPGPSQIAAAAEGEAVLSKSAGVPTSPFMVSCGQGFFSASQTAMLGSQFGDVTCFRFATSNVWIVVGDGMSLTSQATPPAASPGGSIVATLACASGDTSCLSATSQHDFASFSVNYPPVPLNGRLNLQVSAGTNLLTFNVGNCGLFGLDVQNGEWFGGTASQVKTFIADPSSLSPIRVPGATTGLEALSSPAPAPISADCTE